MRRLIEEYGLTLLYIITGVICIALFSFAFFGNQSSISRVVNSSIDSTANQDFSIVYTISYSGMDGATFGNQEVPSTYTKEDRVFLPTPSKEGYLFAGWTGTRLSNPTINVVIPEGSTGNRSYTATWTKGYYRIVYDSNLATMKNRYYTIDPTDVTSWMSGETESQLVEYGHYPTFKKSDFNFLGHKFLGWSTNREATKNDALYQFGSSATNDLLENTTVSWTVNEITLYAIWDKEIYTIDYVHANQGNKLVTNDNPATYTVTDEIKLNTASLEGYTFGGWYTRDPYIEDNEDFYRFRNGYPRNKEQYSLEIIYGTGGIGDSNAWLTQIFSEDSDGAMYNTGYSLIGTRNTPYSAITDKDHGDNSFYVKNQTTVNYVEFWYGEQKIICQHTISANNNSIIKGTVYIDKEGKLKYANGIVANTSIENCAKKIMYFVGSKDSPSGWVSQRWWNVDENIRVYFHYYNEEAEGPVDIIMPGTTGNMTLYSYFEANKYQFRVHYKTTTAGDIIPQGLTDAYWTFEKTYDQDLTLKLSSKDAYELKRSGYDFLGFDISANDLRFNGDKQEKLIKVDEVLTDSVIGYKESDYKANPSSYTINAYGVWGPHTYIIEYQLNGGINGPGVQTKTYGVNLRLSSIVPEKEGYTFTGWFISNNTAHESETLQPGTLLDYDLVTEDMDVAILSAKWEANEYKATLDINSPSDEENSEIRGLLEEEIYVTFDQEYSELPTLYMAPTSLIVPSKTYKYEFTGWYLEKECINRITNDTIVKKANNHTLYAGWKPVSYIVKLHSNY